MPTVNVALRIQSRLGRHTITLDEYRTIEPHLTRPLTWPPTGRRNQRNKAAPEPQPRAA